MVQSLLAAPEEAHWRSTTHLPYEFTQRRTVYWTVFAYEAMTGLGLVIWASMEDPFYVALINMNCGHLIELKERLSRLGADGIDDNDLLFYKELVECCKRYEGCLRSVGSRFIHPNQGLMPICLY